MMRADITPSVSPESLTGARDVLAALETKVRAKRASGEQVSYDNPWDRVGVERPEDMSPQTWDKVEDILEAAVIRCTHRVPGLASTEYNGDGMIVQPNPGTRTFSIYASHGNKRAQAACRAREPLLSPVCNVPWAELEHEVAVLGGLTQTAHLSQPGF